MTDYGQTDTSTTTLGANQFPVSAVFVPGDTKLTAVQGGPKLTDGNGKTYSPMATYTPDGNDVTQGTSTDANTVNSIMGRLTKIRDLLNTTLTVGGTITEANSAAIKTDLDTVNTAIGLVSDAAWSGSGNGDVIAILKKIVAELAGTLAVSGTFWQATQPVSGTVTANAGTNLNTSALALEAGHLATIDTHTPALGQATMANSSPVAIASNQSAFPVSQGAGAAAGTSWRVAGDFTEVAGQVAANVTSTSTPIILATDVSAFKSWAFSMSGTWSMTLQVQFSNDNANWTAAFFYSLASSGLPASIIANGQYYGSTLGRWMRIIPSAWVSNASGVGILELYTSPISPHSTEAVQSGSWTVQPGNTANTTAWKVDGSAVTQPVSGTFWQATQPVSGTVTANAGTGPFPSAGMVASGSANANNPIKTGGVFNTTQPTVTTGQVVDAQTTARGAAIVATGVDTFNATINAALPAGTNVIGHVIADSGSTTAATQATASNLNAQVVGAVASAGANAGNPLKTGGAFNTTQPTVTTGQIVDAQYTARGAAIVATGADAFAVNATQAGTWTVQPGNTANTTPWLVKPHDGTNPLFLAAAALADATSNPTIGGIQDFAMRFNGTSWDRARNNVNTTTGDSGTKTATFAGAAQTNYDALGAIITILLGTVSGTTPTLAAQLQWSPDGGTTWLTIGAALANLTATSQTGTIWAYPTNISTAGATPAALTTGATVTLQLNTPLPRTWRLNYTIGGTTPSFAISSVQVNYLL